MELKNLYNKKIFVLITLILMLSFSFADLTTDLVSYYDFNETSGNLLDLTANSYDGSNTGITYSQTGIINDAYSFNGSTSKSNLGNNDLGIATGFTISAWIKTSTSGYLQIMARDTSSNKRYFQFRLNDGVLEIIRWDLSNTLIGFVSSTGTVNNGAWHHVAVVFDNSVGTTLYIDGSPDGTDSLTTNNQDGLGLNTIIGAREASLGSYSDFFNGLIDETGIWNRALTSTNVNELYNGGDGLTYPFITESVTADFDY